MLEEVTSKLDEIRSEINESLLYSLNDFDILGGHASISLFLFNYYQYSNNENDLSLAIDFLERAILLIGKDYRYFSLSGLSGIAWLAEYSFRNRFVNTDINLLLQEVDVMIVKFNEREYDNGNFDFLHGTCGSILYLLQRSGNSEVKHHIFQFVDKLEFAAEIDEQNNFYKWSSKKNVNGVKSVVYNLSLSHGIAAIISILTKICQKKINLNKAKRILTGAINYLLSSEIKNRNFQSKFPGYKHESDNSDDCRLSWCYGDVGIAIALYNASEVLNDRNLKQKSIDILLNSTNRRSSFESGVHDASFCHGASGLAYIYSKFYNETEVLAFHDASKYWYQRTLEYSKYNDGFAGYKSKLIDTHVPSYGLLLGISGIGLSLLFYMNSESSKWDDLLLIS